MQMSLPPPSVPAKQSSPFTEARAYITFGIVVIVTLLGGLGVWAATVDLAGAVMAAGSVVVDSSVKKVQHPTGGVVGAIYVKEGQHVEAGDVVVRLDETVTRANLQMVSKQLDEIAVRQARLTAEQDDRSEIAFPADISPATAIRSWRTSWRAKRRCSTTAARARQGLRSQLRERDFPVARGNRWADGPARGARAGNRLCESRTQRARRA